MKPQLWWGLGFVAVIVLIFYLQGKLAKRLPDEESPAMVAGKTAASTNVRPNTNRNVVILTGDARKDKAMHCLEFVAGLSNQMPKERGTAKPMIMALAGVLFFDDSLMARMTNGYITATSNEIRRDFTNACQEVFSGHPPPEVVQGFEHAMKERSNLHESIEQQYRDMADAKIMPELAREYNTVDSVIRKAGINDAPQSDLKELCFGLASLTTTTELIYGPHSDVPVPDEYNAMMDSVKQILKWRLTVIYNLDPIAAQALADTLPQAAVSHVSESGLQPPAYLQ